MTMAVPAVVAACYFCLGEEADEEGMTLVRDCSCRGDSAGFAHLSCLVKYAEQMSKRIGEGNGDLIPYAMPWHTCNYCKQPFQNQLSLDLAFAFVSFAEATFGREGERWDKLLVMSSLRTQIEALKHFKPKSSIDKAIFNENITSHINKLLSLVDQAKKELKMSGWIHMSKDSEEYKYYTILSADYEAFSYSALGGMLMSLDHTKEDMTIAIKHMKKARAIYNLVDMKKQANQQDANIAVANDQMLQANVQSHEVSSAGRSIALQNLKSLYESHLNENGMNPEHTISIGLSYARNLFNAFHRIEAERLVTKLSTVSRRVHGSEHNITIEANELLDSVKGRLVILHVCESKMFQALRYENDGEFCVVQGPITIPRKKDNERMYRFESILLLPACPVICHGLISASHLNGELGDVRHFKDSNDGIRVGVQFEKKGLKSALVKPENLRIAFELPGVAEF